MSTKDKIILCECGNCNWQGRVSECNDVHRLLNHVGSGEEFSVGECPKCGALTYLVNPLPDENKDRIPRVIISVSGGVADLIFK